MIAHGARLVSVGCWHRRRIFASRRGRFIIGHGDAVHRHALRKRADRAGGARQAIGLYFAVVICRRCKPRAHRDLILFAVVAGLIAAVPLAQRLLARRLVPFAAWVGVAYIIAADPRCASPRAGLPGRCPSEGRPGTCRDGTPAAFCFASRRAIRCDRTGARVHVRAVRLRGGGARHIPNSTNCR